MNTPFPPVNSVERSAAGPGGRGRVVVVTGGTDELELLVLGAALFLLLEQAVSPTSAIATAIVAACTLRRDIWRDSRGARC
jgi:hypothetical protein